MYRLAPVLLLLLTFQFTPVHALETEAEADVADALPPTAEPVAKAPPATGSQAVPGDRAAAEAAAAEGRKALQLYRKDQTANPNAVVDAAVAFTEAHRQYLALADMDAVAEMQASIYWCKKQMNLDTVKSYLAVNGKSEALASMNAVAEKKVEINEAQDYLDRARTFATNHPKDLSAISMRYFEVAQRFVGTPISIEAQKLSMQAQDQFMQWLQSGGLARETRFTKAVAATSGTKVAIPDEKAQKSALAEVKKVYAKDYSQKKDAQKRRFAAKLVSEGEKSRGDATVYYVMLNEAIRLAMESEDYERLLDTTDLLAGTYNGYARAEQQKMWLKKINGRVAAAAIVTLLDTPNDPHANTTAGKFFCLQLKRWEQGLSMLALSGDPELKAVSEQELAQPTTDEQRVQIGDAWLAIAKKGGPSIERFAMMSRAQFWYVSAKDIDGVVKERVGQRLAEIDKSLPLELDNLDYDNLTPNQWDKLKGQIKVVPVRVDRSGPMINLKAGERIRVVPHPSDTWTCEGWGGMTTSTWSGQNNNDQGRNGNNAFNSSFDTPNPNFRFLELLAVVDKGDVQRCGVITGPGNLWMIPNRPNGKNSGEIRIKLIAVDD